MERTDEVTGRLVDAGFHADLDGDAIPLKKKIRTAQTEQYNYVAVVGEREAAGASPSTSQLIDFCF